LLVRALAELGLASFSLFQYRNETGQLRDKHTTVKMMDNQNLMEHFNTSLTENFFQELTTDVYEKYDIIEEIREGKYGPIYKVKPRDPNSIVRVYSLKTIHLNRVSRVNSHQREVMNEINALKALDHPNIIKLFEVFYNNDDAHLVQEYTIGDDLYSRSPYTEREAARISSQLASAVAHMHEKGVTHGDLKFENIVF